MVALPGQLFYSTQVPVCLLLIAKNLNTNANCNFRDRRNQALFTDASNSAPLSPKLFFNSTS